MRLSTIYNIFATIFIVVLLGLLYINMDKNTAAIEKSIAKEVKRCGLLTTKVYQEFAARRAELDEQEEVFIARISEIEQALFKERWENWGIDRPTAKELMIEYEGD